MGEAKNSFICLIKSSEIYPVEKRIERKLTVINF